MTREEILKIAKPILFNIEMVRAIMDGRKTVTRRVIKPQPQMRLCYAFAGCGHGKWHYPDKNAWEFWGKEFIRPDNIENDELKRAWTPPYHADDILYVRETFCPNYFDEGIAGYRNDGLRGNRNAYKANYHKKTIGDCVPEPKWHPSIHMPKAAARIFLRVTDVRVERLQEITEDGVVAEGAEGLIQCPLEHAIIDTDGSTGDMCWNTGCCKQCDYINKSYGELFGEIVWDSTLKKSDLDRYGWDANPWVWVIEFERVRADE